MQKMREEESHITIADWWLSKLSQLSQERDKELVEKINKMKPILWNDDVNRHLENIARYNTLNEVLTLITSNK